MTPSLKLTSRCRSSPSSRLGLRFGFRELERLRPRPGFSGFDDFELKDGLRFLLNFPLLNFGIPLEPFGSPLCFAAGAD